MNILLIFFAFPIAIIIFSIVLQRLLHSPLTVSAIFFAVFVVITFAFFDQNFLIATLAYTILSYITAVFISFLCNQNQNNGSGNNNNNNNDNGSCNTTTEKNTIDDEDNVINNNCGYMYNRRCRKF